MPEPLVTSLIALVERARSNGTSPEAAAAAKRVLLDSLGCALGAVRYQLPATIVAIAAQERGSRGCTVIGSGGDSTAEMAAFANGVMIRYLDYNDAYVGRDGIGHPSDYIAALMAVAEETDADPASFVTAIVLVYEVFARLTDALPLGIDRFDHVTIGAIAAAVGTGYLWGLSTEQLADAVALATVPNAALIATRYGTVSMWKGCASANASRNGIFAARLASKGITGPSEPFEGRGGLCGALGVKVDWSAFDDADRAPSILNSHLKAYPVGFLAQSAIEASLKVRQHIPNGTRVEAVRVATCEYAYKVMAGEPQKWDPATRETADHSLPYAVAHALVNGSLGLESFNREALGAPRVREMLRRVTVTEDPNSTAGWPHAVISRVTVTLADGTTRSAETHYHKGHARNPMSQAELEAKFVQLAEPFLGRGRCAEVINSVMAIEQVSIRELLTHLNPET